MRGKEAAGAGPGVRAAGTGVGVASPVRRAPGSPPPPRLPCPGGGPRVRAGLSRSAPTGPARHRRPPARPRGAGTSPAVSGARLASLVALHTPAGGVFCVLFFVLEIPPGPGPLSDAGCTEGECPRPGVLAPGPEGVGASWRRFATSGHSLGTPPRPPAAAPLVHAGLGTWRDLSRPRVDSYKPSAGWDGYICKLRAGWERCIYKLCAGWGGCIYKLRAGWGRCIYKPCAGDPSGCPGSCRPVNGVAVHVLCVWFPGRPSSTCPLLWVRPRSELSALCVALHGTAFQLHFQAHLVGYTQPPRSCVRCSSSQTTGGGSI